MCKTPPISPDNLEKNIAPTCEDPSVSNPSPAYSATFKDNLEEGIVEIIKEFKIQMTDEAEERKKLLYFLKISLYVLTLLPFVLIFKLMYLGIISEPTAIIASIVAIPIEIIGVFAVISKGLFADTYRSSLPEMIAKYKEFTGWGRN